MTIIKHLIAIAMFYFINLESGIVTTIAIGLIYASLECQRYLNTAITTKLINLNRS